MSGHSVTGLVLRRLLTSVPALVLILVLVFVLLKMAPGDTVDALLAQVGGGGDPAMVEAMRRQYGLDLSLPVQLGKYLLHLVQLDLGMSAIYAKPVGTLIVERLPVTLFLMGSALCFSLAVGAAVGGHRGAEGAPLARYRDLGVRRGLLCHALLLVRADGHRHLLGATGLVSLQRLRGHRRRADRPGTCAGHRPPSGAADAVARPDLAGDLPAP